jgi:hypothetical protein
MAGRLEVSGLGVALLTTERVVDLVMAHQTICHLRHVGFGHRIRISQPSVASLTRIRGVQMPTDVAGRLQIVVFVNRCGNHLSYIAHSKVLLMAEMGHYGGTNHRNGHFAFLVTLGADGLSRQEVVFRFVAGSGSRVTIGAVWNQLEVEFVRKGRGGRRAPHYQNEERLPHPL